jgi:hypothetical protein
MQASVTEQNKPSSVKVYFQDYMILLEKELKLLGIVRMMANHYRVQLNITKI